jgi:hypothetical protein
MLRYWWDPEEKEIYTDVYLPDKPWYKRIWLAIKYVFGYKCRYGFWDCTVMGMDKVEKLYLFLQHCMMDDGRKS